MSKTAGPKEPSFPIVPLPLIRQIAVDAGTHEKTVRRLIIGLATRPAGRARILAAMAKHGVVPRRPPRDLPPGEDEPPYSPHVEGLITDAARAYAEAAALGVNTTGLPDSQKGT